MFTDASNHYFVEPVPVYLHNIHGEIHEKPHIVFRRSLEETKKSYSRVVGSNLWNGSLKKNPKGLNLYLEYFIIVLWFLFYVNYVTEKFEHAATKS